MAVVVSYNGRDTIAATVRALQPQVGRLLIVDNGSEDDTLAVVDGLARDCGVDVLRLGQNRGIGYALNRGAECANAGSYAWLLTMDQDSIVDRNLIAAYCAESESSPTTVCFTPCINGRTNSHPVPSYDRGYAITSGNLVKLSVLEEVGKYDEDLFVDCVDLDFSLRLRQAGYAIRRVTTARMSHQLGERTSIPGFVSVIYARHSPLRRYYMCRNYLYLVKWHFWRFPAFLLKMGLMQIVLLVLVGPFDASPLKSYRAICRGCADFFAGRTGPYAGQLP